MLTFQIIKQQKLVECCLAANRRSGLRKYLGLIANSSADIGISKKKKKTGKSEISASKQATVRISILNDERFWDCFVIGI